MAALNFDNFTSKLTIFHQDTMSCKVSSKFLSPLFDKSHLVPI